MGWRRNFCFFIVIEQIIICNYTLFDTIAKSEASSDHPQAILWIKLFSALIEVFVASILALGLIERHNGKFMPWLFVNGAFCLVITVYTVVVFSVANNPSMSSSFLSQISHKTNCFESLIGAVIQWIVWLTVLLYYRHSRVKNYETNNVANFDCNRLDRNRIENSNQPICYNVPIEGIEERWPLNRMYATLPTAPPPPNDL